MKSYFFLIILLLSFNVASVKGAETNELKDVNSSEAMDAGSLKSVSASVIYAPFDLIIPGKIGASIGWRKSPQQFFELEYLSGKVAVPYMIAELGSMTDNRYSALLRTKESDSSFNLIYGLTFFDFNILLGDRFVNTVSGGRTMAIDVVTAQSIGVTFGFGNRWNFGDKAFVGLDWFTWSQPLIAVNNKSPFLDQASASSEKDEVEKATKILAYFPRISLLKVSFGMRF